MMNKILSINERILYIIDNQCNKNQKKFAEIIGFSPQVIGNIVSGRKSKPSFDVLYAISSSFVDVNPEWLLTGKGEMLRPSEGLTISASAPQDRQKEIDRLLELLEKKDEEIEALKKAQNERLYLPKAAESSAKYELKKDKK